jgi:hypothetical protein
MTDTTSSEGSATLADGKPVTGNPSGGATPPKLASTLEEALARIAELERHAQNKEQEAARHGKNLSAAEKELAAYKSAEQAKKDAELTESERVKKQHADLQAKYESETAALITRIVNLQVKEIATKLGIIDPDAAVRLIDEEFEVDDEGNVTNAEELLKALLKNKPYLAGTPAPAPTAPQARLAPATPAMNPGRSSIVSPGQSVPGRVPSWEEVFKRPGR